MLNFSCALAIRKWDNPTHLSLLLSLPNWVSLKSHSTLSLTIHYLLPLRRSLTPFELCSLLTLSLHCSWPFGHRLLVPLNPRCPWFRCLPLGYPPKRALHPGLQQPLLQGIMPKSQVPNPLKKGLPTSAAPPTSKNDSPKCHPRNLLLSQQPLGLTCYATGIHSPVTGDCEKPTNLSSFKLLFPCVTGLPACRST